MSINLIKRVRSSQPHPSRPFSTLPHKPRSTPIQILRTSRMLTAHEPSAAPSTKVRKLRIEQIILAWDHIVDIDALEHVPGCPF